jgi:hypothetical protein
VSQARKLIQKYTKPWADGIGILPNALHEKFASEFRQIKRGFDDAVAEFVPIYPEAIRERKRRLNGLFNPKDYPAPEEIAGKFQMVLRTLPVPDAGDFRADVLDADTVEDIRRQITESADAVLDDAMKHSAKQIVEVVGHMSEKLKEFDANEKAGTRSFFTASLVNNVRELAELLPAFNFANDPAFEAIVARINKELCAEDSNALRDNDKARKAVRKSADSILKDVSALLG